MGFKYHVAHFLVFTNLRQHFMRRALLFLVCCTLFGVFVHQDTAIPSYFYFIVFFSPMSSSRVRIVKRDFAPEHVDEEAGRKYEEQEYAAQRQLANTRAVATKFRDDVIELLKPLSSSSKDIYYEETLDDCKKEMGQTEAAILAVAKRALRAAAIMRSVQTELNGKFLKAGKDGGFDPIVNAAFSAFYNACSDAIVDTEAEAEECSADESPVSPASDAGRAAATAEDSSPSVCSSAKKAKLK